MNALPTRRRSYWHPASVAAASCVLMICSGSGPATLAAASTTPAVGWRADSLRPNAVWNTLTAEMSVKRRHVAKTGETTRAASPATSYRIERSSRSGSWKTVITVLGVERAPIYSLSGTLVPPDPFPISRIEDDEDGTPVRVYDRAGRLLTSRALPASLDATASFGPARSSGRDWIDTFVATAAKRTARQKDFERVFGKAARAGALNRFLKKDLDSSQEVLVDPKNVVPMETNATRSGTLTAHRTYTYFSAPEGAVVRGSVHSETLTSPDTGERAIVDTAFSNIRLELRR